MPQLESVSKRNKVVDYLQKTVDDLKPDLRKRLIGRSMPAWSYSWVVEPHYHGVAVRLLYKRTTDGIYALEEAATRGDGLHGSDITHHALSAGIGGLPAALTLPPSAPHGNSSNGGNCSSSSSSSSSSSGSSSNTCIAGGGDGVAASAPSAPAATGGSAGQSEPQWVEVRGEVFLTADDLKQVNADLEAAGQPPFPSGRKAAAAALKLADPDQCRTRRLSFVAYEALSLWVCGAATGAGDGSAEPRPVQGRTQARPLHSSHWRTLQWLEAAGFAVSPDNMLCLSAEEAVEEATRFMSVDQPLDYDTEGVVIKLSDTLQYGNAQSTAADGPYSAGGVGGGGSGGATPPLAPPVAWAYNARQRAARRPSAVPGQQAATAGSRTDTGVRTPTRVAGLNVCIAGRLKDMSHTAMARLLEAHGATVSKSVTCFTDVMVVGTNPGARRLGYSGGGPPYVNVVTEEQFWQQYGANGAAAAAAASGGTTGTSGGGATHRQLDTMKLRDEFRGWAFSTTGVLKGPGGVGIVSRYYLRERLKRAGAFVHDGVEKGPQGTPTQILVIGTGPSKAEVQTAKVLGITILDEEAFWKVCFAKGVQAPGADTHPW